MEHYELTKTTRKCSFFGQITFSANVKIERKKIVEKMKRFGFFLENKALLLATHWVLSLITMTIWILNAKKNQHCCSLRTHTLALVPAHAHIIWYSLSVNERRKFNVSGWHTKSKKPSRWLRLKHTHIFALTWLNCESKGIGNQHASCSIRIQWTFNLFPRVGGKHNGKITIMPSNIGIDWKFDRNRPHESYHLIENLPVTTTSHKRNSIYAYR